MKKTLAILFLFVHLFNICGVQVFFSFAEKLADKQMIALLDENKYNDADLIQIELPLNIPYTTDWKDYERCDGQVVLNGIHYNYVKRIVYNDTMYLYCVPNQHKTALSNTKTEYAKQVTDFPANKKNEQSAVKKSGVPNEYNADNFQFRLSMFNERAGQYHFFSNNKLLTGFITRIAQPPEVIS